MCFCPRGDSLLLSFAGGWRLALAWSADKVIKALFLLQPSPKMSVLQVLLNVNADKFGEAWAKLFFEPTLVQALKTEVNDVETANQLLAAGAS